jgi:hypothetical protein
MTAFILILVALAAGGGLWYHRLRRAAACPSPTAQTQALRPSDRRFTGKGVVPTPGPPRPLPVVAAGGQDALPRARFSGGAYIPLNAIGLACGRPVAECKRGRDCLCSP